MGATTMIALTALSTGAQYVQHRKQGERAARQNDANARLADDQAADALARGGQSAQRARLLGQGALGANKVALAGQGVALGSGTAADLLAETEQISELDRLTILNNAQREAWGYKMDAANSLGAAADARSSSRSAARQTLLTGAASLYAMPKPSINRRRGTIPGTRLTPNANDLTRPNHDYSNIGIRQPKKPR